MCGSRKPRHPQRSPTHQTAPRQPEHQLTSFEALAVAALRRWCAERRAIRAGHAVNLQANGYTPRNSRACDARFVRVLSFEQIFGTLEDCQQSALLLAYRDGLSAHAMARSLRLCVPVAQARLAAARLSLANALDRCGLL
jgi:DNA-directed RNA polymerase specialized sigma24 family protein